MNELGPAIALFEELLRERGELMQAISYWRASDRVEAPDRVAEFAELLAELEKEILSMKKRLGVLNLPTSEDNVEEQGGKNVENE